MAVGGYYWQSLWLNRKLKALYYDKFPLNFHIVNYVNKPSNLPVPVLSIGYPLQMAFRYELVLYII